MHPHAGLDSVSKGQKIKGLGTCEEGGEVAVPAVLEPAPVHDHATAAPAEACDVRVAAGGPLGFPERDRFGLELLWISRGVGDPALDEFVIEREATIDELCLLEVFLEIEALDRATVTLRRSKVELEC